jgi:Sigma-70, region 4
MARAVKLHSHDRADWDNALALYREQLRFYLDYLIQCECDHQILATVEDDVRERSVPDDFKFGFMVRTLVRKVIEHLRGCTHQRESSFRLIHDPQSPAASIPAQERMVYFMRDILGYSTRDTSLLVGISDSHVERLLSFARKRIDMTEGPSFLEIETPGWTVFRWKFMDLHPN